ncbi:MAG: 3-phosphoshikimate 1-carboxyvinyltransferase [bacterium]|nr:3-phosphoshikimate 1-carboxyvinyltransferase [bacterium]
MLLPFSFRQVLPNVTVGDPRPRGSERGSIYNRIAMGAYRVPKLNLRRERIEITVPSSKSMANRALILSALSAGSFRVDGDFLADDIQIMIQSLQKLGIAVESDERGLRFQNDLSWRENSEEIELFLGNSGTSMRFLSALVTLRKGITILTGKERMKERPIGDLVNALRDLGVEVEYLEKEGYPPLRVVGRGSVPGGSIQMKGDVSSQFLSALLLAGSAFDEGLEIELEGELISKPYVEMTMRMIEEWGMKNEKWKMKNGKLRMKVSPVSFQGHDYQVEGDASAAVYWWALGFLQNAEVIVRNVPDDSVQGDVGFRQLLKKVETGLKPVSTRLDMSDMPDASLMLMAIAPMLMFPIRIEGIASLRIKETDRIEAMVTELRKLGGRVETGEDWIMIYPMDLDKYQVLQNVQIDTYDDHRVAMSMAILGTRLGNLEILDRDCVNKTYPGFWEELERISKNP